LVGGQGSLVDPAMNALGGDGHSGSNFVGRFGTDSHR
jgi:hypothetical protein